MEREEKPSGCNEEVDEQIQNMSEGKTLMTTEHQKNVEKANKVQVEESVNNLTNTRIKDSTEIMKRIKQETH